MVKPIQRLDDPNNSGGVVNLTDGNTSVYANDRLVAVNTSSVGAFKLPGPNLKPPFGTGAVNTATDHGSKAVFAHNQPINYTSNNDLNGALRMGGSGDVFVGDDIDQDIPSIRQVVEDDDEDVFIPGFGQRRFEELKSNGTISKREQQVQEPPPTGQKNVEASKFTGRPTTACGGIELIVEPPGQPPLQGKQLEAIVLSPNFTVGKLTRKPFVAFDNPLIFGTTRISLGETVCNLKLLAINCLEPLIRQYPTAFVTNTWRADKKPGTTSQHGIGQAADIQFRNARKSDYYIIAQWVKDNMEFDQFLLEYKTTGTRLPWLHISFNKNRPNRRQVLTFLNDRTYAQGLVDLAAT
jgi:hypothetical protein